MMNDEMEFSISVVKECETMQDTSDVAELLTTSNTASIVPEAVARLHTQRSNSFQVDDSKRKDYEHDVNNEYDDDELLHNNNDQPRKRIHLLRSEWRAENARAAASVLNFYDEEEDNHLRRKNNNENYNYYCCYSNDS